MSFASSSSVVVFVHRVLVLTLYSAAIYWYNWNHISQTLIRQPSPFGLLAFWTIWNLYLQYIFFILLFVAHFANNSIKQKKIDNGCVHKFFNYYLFAIVWPISFNVVCSFWILLISGLMVFNNKKIEENYPLWLNIIVHVVVAIAPIIEVHLNSKRYRLASLTKCFLVFNLFMLSYGVLTFYVGLVYDYWPYSFLHQFGWSQRLAFSAVYCILSNCLFAVSLVVLPTSVRHSALSTVLCTSKSTICALFCGSK